MHTLRIPDDLYELIREHAQRNYRTTNQQAVCTLYDNFKYTPSQSGEKKDGPRNLTVANYGGRG